MTYLVFFVPFNSGGYQSYEFCYFIQIFYLVQSVDYLKRIKLLSSEQDRYV